MFGWQHWLDGLDFEQAPGDGDGQGSLVYCSPWGHKESDTTEWLDWTDMQKNQNGLFCHHIQKKIENKMD